MVEKLLKGKKALLVVAYNDYQDLEFRYTRDVLKKSGVKVSVASSSLGTARGKLGGEVKVDVLINEVDVVAYDAIVFIGGPGATEYVNSEDAYQVARQAAEKKKVLAAICMAPQILAKAGVLSGKEATAWKSDFDKSGIEVLEEGGAGFKDQPVVTDGSIVTANGPEAAFDFGGAIVEALKKDLKL
jgi:protease I